MLATAALVAGALTLQADPAGAFCNLSVFSHHPCAPTTCSVFRHRPCFPHYEPWIGQDLRLTIVSAADDKSATLPPAAAAPDANAPDHKLNSLREMFAALRSCWVPPPADDARTGMQMTVRFAFKRSGDIIAEPRVTYTSPGASSEARETYRQAITAALERCTPLAFSDGLGGAVAGRPIAIRFVDNRTHEGQQGQP
jgi:hypothetical protein